MKRKILILGRKGQLGSEFENILKDNGGYSAFFLSREDCDISNLNNVLDVFDKFRPDIVINCAAYNLVDQAEENPSDAMRINYLGVYNLAIACSRFDSFLVHYSTDYVFDGTKEGLYTEKDRPNPLNVYAKSKLYGENAIEENLERYLIFRTSWVYGSGTQNFLYKLTQWAQKQENLKIACDEFSVPTSTRTLVKVTLKAIGEDLAGLYHLVNSGYTSRFGWAREFLRLKDIKKFVYPAYQMDFNLRARRPRFSAMSNEKLERELGIEIAEWRDELSSFIQ